MVARNCPRDALYVSPSTLQSAGSESSTVHACPALSPGGMPYGLANGTLNEEEVPFHPRQEPGSMSHRVRMRHVPWDWGPA